MRKAVLIIMSLFFLAGAFYSLESGFLFKRDSLVMAKDSLRKAQNYCAKETKRSKYILCLRGEIKEDVSSYGVLPFMLALEEDYQKKGATVGVTKCHDIGHAIGQSGAIYSKDINQTINNCTSLCTSGCYHGVVEGYILRGQNLLEILPSICDDGKSSLDRTKKEACYHGVGHGVATIAGAELFKALELCDLLPEEGRRDCGSGVFMELYEPSSFEKPPLSLPEDIPAFCENLWGSYREICHVTAGIHEYAKEQSEESGISTCLDVPEEFRDDCVFALGQNMFSVYDGEVESIFGFCEKPETDELRHHCIRGAISSSVNSDPEAKKAFLICQNIEKDRKETCYSVLGGRVEFTHGKEKRNKLCKDAGEFRDVCLEDR